MHESDNTTLNPYLMFEGNCEEAMSFYKNAVNGELEIMPVEGSPMKVPEEFKNKVMHATLRFGDAIIMASDNMQGQEVSYGNGYAISIASSNLKDAEAYFTKLSEGGQILMPFEETFWGAKFGMFIDKFGVSWMVNCELDK